MAEYDHYRRIKLLGQGSFGKAYLVESLSDGELCVQKQMDLNNMTEDEKKETIKEARILEALKHPNIVRFREVYKTKKGKLCIVMDYADGGDLANKIKEAKQNYFSENLILDWFTQIALAIKHCHDRKIIHRDLKSQNIFMTKKNQLLLGDFGIAKVLGHTREQCKTMVGTPYYLPPEILNSSPYSFKADIWSLGVILYELCALKPPFDAVSIHHLAIKIVAGKFMPIPNVYSRDMQKLVQWLLQTDPTKRPNIHEILKAPIIQRRIRSFLTDSIRSSEFSHTILHKKKFVNENDNNVQYPQPPMPKIAQKNIPFQQNNQMNNIGQFQVQQQAQLQQNNGRQYFQNLNNPRTPQYQPQKNLFFNNPQMQQNGNKQEQDYQYQYKSKLMEMKAQQQQQQQLPIIPLNNNKNKQNEIAQKQQILQNADCPSYVNPYAANVLYEKPKNLKRVVSNEEKAPISNRQENINKEKNQNKILENIEEKREEERQKMKNDIRQRKAVYGQQDLQIEWYLNNNNSNSKDNESNTEQEDSDEKIKKGKKDFEVEIFLPNQQPKKIQENVQENSQIDNKQNKNSNHQQNIQLGGLKRQKSEPLVLQQIQSQIQQNQIQNENENGALMDVSHMPNDQEYFQQVLNEIEQIFEENQNEDNEQNNEINAQKELDESVALVMKKYEQDKDREDDYEDIFIQNSEIELETPTATLLEQLKIHLGEQETLKFINFIRHSINQDGLDEFASKGFELIQQQIDFLTLEQVENFLGMATIFVIMHE